MGAYLAQCVCVRGGGGVPCSAGVLTILLLFYFSYVRTCTVCINYMGRPISIADRPDAF